MRIASLQPSITLTLSALERLDVLCAHTRYCVEAIPELAELRLPVIADSWSASAEQILATKPSLVLTSVPYRMESLAAILKASLPVLALAPKTLDDVLNDFRIIGSLVNASNEAEALVARFTVTVDDARKRTANLKRPRVYCEEWGKPLIHSQAWVAELVEVAGGEFVGAPGAHTGAETIAEAEPDVMLFAWCGVDDRVPLERVVAKRNWHQLRAVKERRVFCIPDHFLNTPADNLLKGLACLGAAIHPKVFPQQAGMIQLKEEATARELSKERWSTPELP